MKTVYKEHISMSKINSMKTLGEVFVLELFFFVFGVVNAVVIDAVVAVVVAVAVNAASSSPSSSSIVGANEVL